jgi:hypothetical protein
VNVATCQWQQHDQKSNESGEYLAARLNALLTVQSAVQQILLALPGQQHGVEMEYAPSPATQCRARQKAKTSQEGHTAYSLLGYVSQGCKTQQLLLRCCHMPPASCMATPACHCSVGMSGLCGGLHATIAAGSAAVQLTKYCLIGKACDVSRFCMLTAAFSADLT